MKPIKTNTISDPRLFTQQEVIEAIQSQRYTPWRDQPLWPKASVSFSQKDDYHRRAILRALTAPEAPKELQDLGYQIFMCSRSHECGSPFCHHCRHKLGKRYLKRIKQYFSDEDMNDLFWITVLDDLTYDPVADIPKWIDPFRNRLKRSVKNSPMLNEAKLFGLIELDAKKPVEFEDENSSRQTLSYYGMKATDEVAYMPHFHGIVAVPSSMRDYVGDELRREFTKPSQVTVKPFFQHKTKADNLKELTKYMMKYRTRFSDNVKNGKPAYGSDFSPDVMRSFVQAVHASKGDRGIRKFEIKLNLS